MNKQKIYSVIYRWGLNLWPCIRSSGGRVIELSEDFRLLRVKLKLNWRTRNVVGTIFGGSMYAATDPFYMLMLLQILGKDFVVWDKGCTIRFKRPAKEEIFAEFKITDEMENDIRERVKTTGECTVTWPLQLKDKNGIVYAEFDKMIFIATKEHYKKKMHSRTQNQAKG